MTEIYRMLSDIAGKRHFGCTIFIIYPGNPVEFQVQALLRF